MGEIKWERILDNFAAPIINVTNTELTLEESK